MKHHLAAAAGTLAAAVALVVLLGAAGYAATGAAFERVRHLQEVARQRPFTNGEIDQLTSLASDKDWHVRARALTALGHVSTPEQTAKAVKAMREALTDRSDVVRAYAATGLSLVGDTSVIPALTPLLNDPQPIVRLRADRAIGKLYLAAGETDKAISADEAALRVADVDPAFLIPAARDLVAACQKAGRPADAVAFVQSLLADDPTNHTYMELLAIAYEGAGQPDKAAEWHRKAQAVPSPDTLRLKDLSGKEQTLAAYRGKLVLLNFFASW